MKGFRPAILCGDSRFGAAKSHPGAARSSSLRVAAKYTLVEPISSPTQRTAVELQLQQETRASTACLPVRGAGRLALRQSVWDSGEVKVVGGPLQLERRPRFAWGRAAFAAGCVGVALLVLNAQHRYEGIYMDDSPFADTWQFCERMEYGWPATGLAVPLSPQECSILPDLSIIGLMFDLCVAVVSVAGLGFVAGGYQRRTFAVQPSADACR